MRVVPAALLCLVLAPAAACGGSGDGPTGDDDAAPEVGTVALRALCPEVHVLVDALVVSSPDAQRTFVEQLQRLSDAGDADAQKSLAPLREAAGTLVEAGVGDGFYDARDGIHLAVLSVNNDCKAVGSPILHGGPHQP